MNESEQEQAIAQIREELKVEFSDYDDLKESAECLLEIVDSQAQKIAQIENDFNLAATIAQEHKDKLDAITEEYADYKHKSGAAVVDLIDKNNEQAKELAEARAIAEKMRDRSERPGGGHAFLPWEKQ